MSGVGYGSKDADGSWGFRATADGKVILGNTSDDVIQVTGSLDINGNIKTSYSIITPTAQDLGSGTTSTLSIGSSLMLLDASSITGTELEPGFDVHTMTVPNGSTHGQKLVLVVEGQFGASGAVGIGLSGNFMGNTPLLMSGTQAIEFVWISTSTISSWYNIT
jgi:hypothetical protein